MLVFVAACRQDSLPPEPNSVAAHTGGSLSASASVQAARVQVRLDDAQRARVASGAARITRATRGLSEDMSNDVWRNARALGVSSSEDQAGLCRAIERSFRKYEQRWLRVAQENGIDVTRDELRAAVRAHPRCRSVGMQSVVGLTVPWTALRAAPQPAAFDSASDYAAAHFAEVYDGSGVSTLGGVDLSGAGSASGASSVLSSIPIGGLPAVDQASYQGGAAQLDAEIFNAENYNWTGLYAQSILGLRPLGAFGDGPTWNDYVSWVAAGCTMSVTSGAPGIWTSASQGFVRGVTISWAFGPATAAVAGVGAAAEAAAAKAAYYCAIGAASGLAGLKTYWSMKR